MTSNPATYHSPSKWCVLIPTYNNAGTLNDIISDVLNYSSEVIVVNDGSTDRTREILQEFESRIESIEFPKNKGKGAALRAGFKRAAELGFTHVISIDSDGQHFPSDIPVFVDQIQGAPDSLVIGARNMNSENVPGKSSFGNMFSNFWFRFETGIKLDDTQSGFRLYPLHAMRNLRFFTKKFEFEVEVIVKAAWSDIPVKNIPIKIHYEPGKARISHFRPFRDFMRISILNTYLVIIGLCYFIPVRVFKKLTYKNISAFLRHHFLDHNEPIKTKSISIGFGVFMGIFPVWGYQMLIGLVIAELLKLNKAIFLVAANISIPPMIPLILYGSYKFGGLYFPESGGDILFSNGIDFETMKENLIQYLLGSISLAVVCGLFFGLLSYLLIYLYRQKTKNLQSKIM